MARQRGSGPLRACGRPLPAKGPVSYTHLDVYKRQVFAYPSIFVIGQKQQAGPRPVAVVTLRSAQAKECQQALRLVQGVQAQDALHSSAPSLQVHARWFVGDEPWVLSSQAQRTLLQTLESRFPALADCAETRVGIGVATGCDRVFVLSSEQAEQLEPDCLLPLVMCQDQMCIRDRCFPGEWRSFQKTAKWSSLAPG